MRYWTTILSIAFCLMVTTVSGQNKIDKKSSRKQPATFRLEQARDIKAKSPTKAIKLLEEAILFSRKEGNRRVEGEAYVLLGNIYESIEQEDLALQRYQQALVILDDDSRELKASVLQRRGQIYIDKGEDTQAEKSFNLCLHYTDKNDLKLICEEGLADVQLLRNDTISLSQLDLLEQKYVLDSFAMARNNARRSQAYVQQKNYTKATEVFNNSISNLPKNQKLQEQDYLQIQKAKEDLLENTEEASEQIAILNNVANTAGLVSPSNDVRIMENLKIIDLYEAERNYPEAEKFIKVTKELVNDETNAGIAAEVYKKSSEFNQKIGAINVALTDIDLYTRAKEKSIQQLEADLKEQIAIVQGQQQIDLLQRDFDLQQKDQALMQSQLKTQKIIIGLLSLLLIASMVFFYFLQKNAKARRQANQLLLLKSLRTQMNPHFIFNALNSVNNFIAKNDEKAANKFLASFSRLMRKVLDYSQKDFIAFEEELELNELYLKLEHFRFRDKFEYTFQNKANQYGYSLEVPPMLIQPFIENAVWHGLRYKEEKGTLSVNVEEKGQNIIVTIEDNGIGRAKSRSLKTKNQKQYKSTGMENVSRRIALINDIYGKNYTINISDLNSEALETGTRVEIKIPLKR